MHTEVILPTGSVRVSATVIDQFPEMGPREVERTYCGFTATQAERSFRRYIKSAGFKLVR
jgi:hypothetical protein